MNKEYAKEINRVLEQQRIRVEERLVKWRNKPVLEKDIGIDYNSYENSPSLLHLTIDGLFRACDTPGTICSYVIKRDGEWTETITIGEFITTDKIIGVPQIQVDDEEERVFIPCEKCRKLIKDSFGINKEETEDD